MKAGDLVRVKEKPEMMGRVLSFQTKSGTVLVELGEELKYFTTWNLERCEKQIDYQQGEVNENR